MVKKHALVIGAISVPHANLIRHGYEITWLLEKNARRHITPAESGRCKNIYNYDPGNGAEFICRLSELINAQHKVDVVMAFHDDAQILASRIAAQLQLPFKLSESAVENTRNKVVMRQILENNRISSVPFMLAATTDELLNFVQSTSGYSKFIAKPIAGTGSEGIVEIDTKAMDIYVLHDLLANLQYPVIAEVFVEGREFSIEAVTYEGQHHIIAITEKFKHPGTYMESGHLVPARIDSSEDKLMRDYVAICLSSLGVNFGLSHSEVILADTGPVLIETHTRGGGDRIADLVKIHTGVDLFEISTRLGLGYALKSADIQPLENGPHACIRFLVQDQGAAEIMAIHGVEAARALCGLVDVSVSLSVGDPLPEVRHSFDRAAFAIASAATAEVALDTAQRAIDAISFETR